jgi:uncharacterized protein YjbI with pentapeptide repeats
MLKNDDDIPEININQIFVGDFSGRDFSEKIFLSCDFRQSTLVGADFSKAIFGLSNSKKKRLIITTVSLCLLIGFLASLSISVFLISFIKSFGYLVVSGILVFLVASVLAVYYYRYIAIVLSIVIAILTASTGIGSILGVAFGILTVFIILLIAILGATLGPGIYATMGLTSVAITGIGSILGAATTYYFFSQDTLVCILNVIFSLVIEILSGIIAKGALEGKEKLAFIRERALAFTTWGGTSFCEVDFTDANFSFATITKIDFRGARFTRTNFLKCKDTESCRFENTILQNRKILDICIHRNNPNLNDSRRGKFTKEYKFNNMLLEGVNWDKADLSGIDFTCSNLNQASLKGTNLSSSKLVQTQLDETDLTGSELTASCIESWGITAKTKIDDIKCRYVFMRALTKDNDERYRMPSNRQEEFQPGDFVEFIRPIVDTLDFYYDASLDPRAFVISFDDLVKNNPGISLKIIGIERRGEGKVLIRAKASQDADLSKLSDELYSSYNKFMSLSLEAQQSVLKEKDDQIKNLCLLLEAFSHKPANYFYGETKVENKYNMQGSQIGAFVEKLEAGATISISQDIHVGEGKRTLAEIAKEIQDLMEHLSKTHPLSIDTHPQDLANEVVKLVDANPNLAGRILSATKAGGVAALEEFLSHPASSFVIAALGDWGKTKRTKQ